MAIGCGTGIGLAAQDEAVRIMNTFCSFFSQLLEFMTPLIIVGLFGTACNVTGDGAIAVIIDHITGKKNE